MSAKAEFGLVVEYVPDVESMTAFFVDVLGLQVERKHPTFVQFKDAEGRRYAIASDESLTGSREPEIYWLVADADAAYHACAAKARVSMPLKQMPFGKVFGLSDPTGQPHFVLELAATRPSEPVVA